MQNARPLPPPFAKASRQEIYRIGSMSYTANTTTSIQIPKTGYLSRVSGILTITFTTAATGTYANKTSRSKSGSATPFDAITRIRLLSNLSAPLWDTTFFGEYLYQRARNWGLDFMSTNALQDGYLSATTDKGFFNLPSSYTTSTQYTIRVPITVYVDTGYANKTGLQLLQTDRAYYNLEVTWGDIATNLLTLGGTTPSITVNSASLDLYSEVFTVPAMLESQPSTAFAHQVIEEIQDITANGKTSYKPPTVGPIIIRAVHELVNNSAAIGPSSIDLVRVVTTANIRPIELTSRQFLYWQMGMSGELQLPDGVYHFDYANWDENPFGIHGGNLIDTSNIVEFAHEFELSGLTVSGAFLRTVRETLVPNR